MRVLVTGAASGIGRATCVRLARDAKAAGRSARVAAVDIGPAAQLDGLVAELRELGADALPLHGDMGTPDAPGRAVAEAVQRFGGLDGLVSNAGINRPGPLVEYAVEDWDRLFAVNTRATWLLAKAAHPALRASGGAIVAVASMSGIPRPRGPRRLRPEQGGRHHAGPRARAGARSRRHPRQLSLAGDDADRDDCARVRRRRGRRRAGRPGAARAAWPCPTTWRRPSHSCSRPTPATSTATTWSSTAASPATTSAACRGSRRSRAPDRAPRRGDRPCPHDASGSD